MKEETLTKVNALLAALVKEAELHRGLLHSVTAAAQSAGLQTGLETARAMRALIARQRVQSSEDGYRVISSEPIRPGEPMVIVPKRRKHKQTDAKKVEQYDSLQGVPTYADIGRAVVERLVALSSDLNELRTGLSAEDHTRLEVAESRADGAEQDADELQRKLAMAETNVREVLRAASLARGGSGEAIDAEAAAVLRFLQGD